MIYELLFNYYGKLPDMCGEASRLSRAKPNMDAWERIRNSFDAFQGYRVKYLALYKTYRIKRYSIINVT